MRRTTESNCAIADLEILNLIDKEGVPDLIGSEALFIMNALWKHVEVAFKVLDSNWNDKHDRLYALMIHGVRTCKNAWDILPIYVQNGD